MLQFYGAGDVELVYLPSNSLEWRRRFGGSRCFTSFFSIIFPARTLIFAVATLLFQKPPAEQTVKPTRPHDMWWSNNPNRRQVLFWWWTDQVILNNDDSSEKAAHTDSDTEVNDVVSHIRKAALRLKGEFMNELGYEAEGV